eukprot:TRINITY_DN10870_c1_g1_i2.p1 TRINITY_DN10870_c1_g1~~TRINITY_DN10870_c1_g1_i2.p1  ORF type:complete len:655 (+),score=132.11 TRINITY_DN10870_c1_g1_i2:147-2111(+)
MGVERAWVSQDGTSLTDGSRQDSLPSRAVNVSVSGIRPAGSQPNPGRPIVSCDVRPPSRSEPARQKVPKAGAKLLSASHYGIPGQTNDVDEDHGSSLDRAAAAAPEEHKLPRLLPHEAHKQERQWTPDNPRDAAPPTRVPVYPTEVNSQAEQTLHDLAEKAKHAAEEEEQMVKRVEEKEQFGTKFAEMAKSMGIDYNSLDPTRQMLHRWISWQGFDTCIGLVIVANAVTIGIEAQLNAIIPLGCDKDCNCSIPDSTCEAMPLWLDIVDYGFLAVYFVELFLRLYTYGFRVLASNWVKFDCFLVVTSLVDVLLKNISIENEYLKKVMLVRMMRLARLARAVRLMVQFRVLWQLVQGLLHSVGTLLWTFLLVMILIYAFAIIGVETIRVDENLPMDHPYNAAASEYFADLVIAGLTLLQCFTLDSIGGVYRPLIMQSPFLLVYFMTVLLIMSIALMNLVTAVMVNSALDQASEDKDVKKAYEEVIKRKQTEQLKAMFLELDADGSGELTVDELHEAPEEVMESLKGIAGTDDIDGLFDMLDYDGGGSLSTDEFCEGVMRASTSDKPMELIRVMKQCGDILQNSKTCVTMLEKIEQERQSQAFVTSRNKEASVKASAGELPDLVGRVANINNSVVKFENKLDLLHHDMQKVMQAVCH